MLAFLEVKNQREILQARESLLIKNMWKIKQENEKEKENFKEN